MLRNTFASVAGDMGYSELTIAGLLGHTGRRVTQRYVHLNKALLLAADKVARRSNWPWMLALIADRNGG
ncbi:hypothetical protein [Acidisoma sp. 7E03]